MANRLTDVIKSIWNGRTATPVADLVALLQTVIWNFAAGLNVTGATALTGNLHVTGTSALDGAITSAAKLTVSAGGAAITGGTVTDSVKVGAAGTVISQITEGVFTPTVAGSTTAGVGTYSAQTGTYTRIGQFVFFNLRVDWTAHTGTGNLQLKGLPVASNGSILSYSLIFNNGNGASFAGGQMLTVPGTTNAGFSNNLGTSNLALAATGSILISGFYQV